MKRPSKIQNYMDVAETVALRSHDAETKVGAVLVNNKSGAIIATGYNGFVRDSNDLILPKKRPDKYQYIIHAESNILCNCCRNGIRTEDCTLICTLTPCLNCTRLLYNAGITNIIAKKVYGDFQEILKMKDIKIKTKKYDEGFIGIRYIKGNK